MFSLLSKKISFLTVYFANILYCHNLGVSCISPVSGDNARPRPPLAIPWPSGLIFVVSAQTLTSPPDSQRLL